MHQIILCAGKDGRALVYGTVETLPEPGQPVELTDACMVIYYPSGGAFGLAVVGPPSGSKVTRSVPLVVETVWQEYMLCKPAAVNAFEAAPRV